jgi:hypothetical protein
MTKRGQSEPQTTDPDPNIELKQTQDSKSVAWCFGSTKRSESEGVQRADLCKVELQERL